MNPSEKPRNQSNQRASPAASSDRGPTAQGGLYVVLISLHGLIRGENLELGRDADTGGQTTYVVELAKALASRAAVGRVDLLTRLIDDPKVDDDYTQPREQIGEKAYIVRIPFGPRRYLRKESLWSWIEQFVNLVPRHFRIVGRVPDILHGHYADAGLAAARLSLLLGVPAIFTGHSLGHEKRRRLLESGVSGETIESRYRMSRRIEAEERALSRADIVVASTSQEAGRQYALYENYRPRNTVVIPPGVDLKRFRPPDRGDSRPSIEPEVLKFLRDRKKPWILTVARPDERKNLKTLVKAYGENEALQNAANLVVVAGSRDDIAGMSRGARTVLTDILLAIDRYDLYGKVAYPKKHRAEDVPGLYRLAAEGGGVFVNPALTEPFGLTLIEAAASGLPIVATDDGGPRDIVATAKNGLLIDPLDSKGMSEKLLDALSDRARWKRWSANGERAAHRYYTWSSHVEKYLNEIERVSRTRTAKRFAAAKSRLPAAERLLLFDIDDSLIGDREGLRALIAKIAGEGSRVSIGVATGRRLKSALQVLTQWNAPPLEVFITSVGSEIYYGPLMNQDLGWRHHIDHRWEPRRIREALDDLPGLNLQGKLEQRGHKVSYFLDPESAPGIREIRGLLRAKGIAASLVYSRGQYLDLLPERASKGAALRYLCEKWGIPMEYVLVAGDSGNDAEMLASRALGVVVGNHSSELDRLRGLDRVYFAEGEYAWGIIEGIDHYRFFADGE